MGTVLRLVSEAPWLDPDASLDPRDNQFAVAADIAWVLIVLLMPKGGPNPGDRILVAVGTGYVVSGFGLLMRPLHLRARNPAITDQLSPPWPKAEVWRCWRPGR